MVSLYKDHFPTEVIRMGQEGKSQTQMAAALGVSQETLRAWSKDPRKPEFNEAMKLALTCAEAYWEDLGQKGTKGILPKFCSGSWIFTMKCRFRDNWKEMNETKMDISSSVKSMSDDELEDTIKALVARKAQKDTGGSAPANVNI